MKAMMMKKWQVSRVYVSFGLFLSVLEEQIEDEQIALQYKKRTGRGRKSVSGERYDPTEDFDNDDPIKVVPKSDEQRKRLQAVAVKIMLLNRLDEVKFI